MLKKIILVAGARPNFMKIAPIHKALAATKRYQPILLHTGQHYDEKNCPKFSSRVRNA